VTVTGTVTVFHLADFTDSRLGDPGRYTAFEGRRAILADDVRVWAPDMPPSSTRSP
jgi:hypothetical protein